MIKHPLMIVSFAIGLSATSALSQEAEPSSLPDAESFVAREIEQGAPIETTGLESSVLGTVSLDAYGETLKSGTFRAREVVLLPGAKIAIHAHDRRPAIVYVLEGEVVEHRSDSEEPLIRRKGDSYFEGPGVAHWLENVSSNRARSIAVDIVPEDVK